MNWTEVPAGEVNAVNQRLWGALGSHADQVASRAKHDKAFVLRIADFARSITFTSFSEHGRAREIMGHNFFGIEEAIRCFGVHPSDEQIGALLDIPYSEETLWDCRDTHALVAVFPMSILDVRAKVRDESNRLFSNHTWYNKEGFANDKGEVHWCLVRKTPLPDSISKNWNEQQALLGENEETPSAQVMVYTIIGHYLATGERLFEKLPMVRTSSVASVGNRVNVGDFDQDGLFVGHWWDGVRSVNIGVSSARKS